MKALTLEQAKNLRYGQHLYHMTAKNADEKTPQCFKVNGKPKTWKRNPSAVQVPLKRGLYEYGYMTEDMLQDFSLDAE